MFSRINVIVITAVVITYGVDVISGNESSQPKKYHVFRHPKGDFVNGFSNCTSDVGFAHPSMLNGTNVCKCTSNGTFYYWEYAGCMPFRNPEYNITMKHMPWDISYVDLLNLTNNKLTFVMTSNFDPPNSTPYKLEKWCSELYVARDNDWIRFVDIPKHEEIHDQLLLKSTAAEIFSVVHDNTGNYYFRINHSLPIFFGRVIALSFDCKENGTYITSGGVQHKQQQQQTKLKMLIKFLGVHEYKNYDYVPPPSATPTERVTTTSQLKTNATVATKKHGGSSSSVAIIGGAVGGVVVIAIICIVFIICFKRRSSGLKKRRGGDKQENFENSNIGGIYTAPNYEYPNLDDPAYINPNVKPPPLPNRKLAPNGVPPPPKSPRPTQHPLSTNIAPKMYVAMSSGYEGGDVEEQYTELTEYRDNSHQQQQQQQQRQQQQQNSSKSTDPNIYTGLNEQQYNNNEHQSEDYADLIVDNKPVINPSDNTYADLRYNGEPTSHDQQYADFNNTPSTNQLHTGCKSNYISTRANTKV